MKAIRIPAALYAPRLRAPWLVTALVLVALGAGAFYLLASDKASAKVVDAKERPLVELVTSTMTDLPHVVEAQGHVIPLNEVEVRPQAEGVVASLNFREGQDVEAGQLLFVLDARDAPALVRQATARYAQTSAELADAKRNYARSMELVSSRYISPSALDAVASKVEILQAQQQAARAEIDSSRIKEAYARISAPISGRAGAVSVRRGALVRPSDAASLVRIVQIDPIAVEFSLPERELGGLAHALKQGQATVSAQTEQGLMEGVIVFTDNSIDPTTGTIRFKAQFDNPQERLWPGAFVSLRVTAGMQRNAVVLPPQAILEGPDGHFVYQVDADEQVHMRPVTFAGIQDGQAIVTGLAAGQAVVSEGNQGLREGVRVRTRANAVAGSTP